MNGIYTYYIYTNFKLYTKIIQKFLYVNIHFTPIIKEKTWRDLVKILFLICSKSSFVTNIPISRMYSNLDIIFVRGVELQNLCRKVKKSTFIYFLLFTSKVVKRLV